MMLLTMKSEGFQVKLTCQANRSVTLETFRRTVNLLPLLACKFTSIIFAGSTNTVGVDDVEPDSPVLPEVIPENRRPTMPAKPELKNIGKVNNVTNKTKMPNTFLFPISFSLTN